MPVVTFLGELRQAAGQAEVTLEADTAARLLAAVAAAIGPGLADLLWTGEELRSDVEVLVNGRNIEFLDRLDTRLRPADRVTIFFSGLRGFPGG